MIESQAPVISVIIPTRNRRDSLIRCVRALAAQTFDPFEVIVVDDASTDGTPEALAHLSHDHRGLQLRWFRNEPQAGANPSRNLAIRESLGAFIAMTDDDCVAEPDWLARLIEPFASDRVAAVVGLTRSAEPSNLFELTLKGTQRVYSPDGVTATRLVGCNMCVRRDLLVHNPLDEDRSDPSADTRVSGRGDEEGLFLVLKAAGYEQRIAPDAIVHHVHPHTGSSFIRQAFRGGRSAARLVYKYHLPPRLDLAPFLMAYLTAPLGFIRPWLWTVPAFCFVAALIAIAYNDLARKGKSVGETVLTFPLLLIYYQVRLLGYVTQTVRLWLGIDSLTRVRLEPHAFNLSRRN